MVFWRSEFENSFLKLLDGVPLSEYDKDVIKLRYVSIVRKGIIDEYMTNIQYILLTMIVSVGSVLVVSLVSLGDLKNVDGAKSVIYWLVWGISLAVVVANKLMIMFAINKKYVLNATSNEKLKSEGWKFLAGIDRYKYTNDYNERFKLFTDRIEKLKGKTVESMSSYVETESESLAGSANDVAMEPDNTTPVTKPSVLSSARAVVKKLLKSSHGDTPVDDPLYARDTSLTQMLPPSSSGHIPPTQVVPLNLPSDNVGILTATSPTVTTTERLPAAHMHAVKPNLTTRLTRGQTMQTPVVRQSTMLQSGQSTHQLVRSDPDSVVQLVPVEIQPVSAAVSAAVSAHPPHFPPLDSSAHPADVTG